VISFTCSRDVFAEDLSRARRAGLAVENPLESPRRVAGVSIGIETNRPAAEIGDLVRREFVVDSAGTFSVEEAAASTEPFARSLGSDRLTYDYPHYLVSLDERRLELAEWSRFAGLKARIEVKTLLQDAWQGIDLDLPFRNASSYPAEVRDLLERSTLGLAAVDADLIEAKHAIERLLAEYEEAVAAGDLQLPVNGVSLLAYIRASELV
jgi:putative GTP pyrophosphokinase